MNNPISKVFLKRIFAATNSSQAASHSKNARKQSGQTIVLILAFAAVLSVGLLMIFNTTQQVVAKRELVNAADAAAYSGATVIAQGLNFTASTNRAILANNALVGQMMSMRSTLAMSHYYWKTTATMWRAIESITKFIPYIGQFASAVSGGFQKFSKYFGHSIKFMRAIAEVMQTGSTAAIGLTNHALWFSQQVHLADSVGLFEVHMASIAKYNAPKSSIDGVFFGTLFGPLATLGGLASNLQVKVRKGEQTFHLPDKAKNDAYLNYVTEENRNVHTPAYVGGRTLMPNAVSLWMAPPGCKLGEEYIWSANFAPKTDTNPVADKMGEIINFLKPLIALIGEDYFCMYERHGGTELVQLKDGQIAWLAVDAINVEIPGIKDLKILDKNLNRIDLGNLPFAGGGAMSFGEPNVNDQRETIKKFISRVAASNGGMLGHQVPLPADCVEFVAPTFVGGATGFENAKSADLQAISLNGRTSGNCAVLATGLEHHTNRAGLFDGHLAGTAGRILLDNEDQRGVDVPSLTEMLRGQLESVFTNATQDFKNELTGTANQAKTDIMNAAKPDVPLPPVPQPGVSNCTNCAATTMPNAASANALGAPLRNALDGLKASYKAKLGTFLNKYLSPDNFKLKLSGLINATAPEDIDQEGHRISIGKVARSALEAFFPIANDLIDFLEMNVNDPVELPRSGVINSFARVFSDGLPPWFWDVRIVDMNQGKNALSWDNKNLISTDEEPNDYHQRRYNLGPVVYMPLKQDPPRLINFSVATKEKTALESYESSSGSVLHAMGKARIFFRQPSDQWMNRYKVVVGSSLLLPFWQVRNESLSYVEKWTLLSLQGLQSVRGNWMDWTD